MPKRPKHCTPSEAAALVRARDSVGLPLGPGQPGSFLQALGERDDFEQLQVFTGLLGNLYKLFTRRGVSMLSGFFGPVERGLRRSGYDVEFVPADFRGLARVVRQLSPRVAATAAALPDSSGRLSLSLHAGATANELHRAAADPERLLIVEVNSKLPRTLGLPPEHPHSLELAEVDVLIESDADVMTIPDPPVAGVARAIAEHALPYIADGATLQTGIGQIPCAVAQRLATGSGGDYGVHSEMFTTGLMELHEAGKVSNKKGIFDGLSIATFAAGTAELYRWLDGRDNVRFLPVDVTNDPAVIAKNRDVVTINGALALDLHGQIAADSIAARQYSGIGGHEDFVSAPLLSTRGRSLVCLPSTSTVGGQLISRIVGSIPTGGIVTTPRQHLDVVVTEHGSAEVFGLTTRERARRLIDVAHPDFRDELRAQLDV
jgi:acyl-CoA hydrolase